MKVEMNTAPTTKLFATATINGEFIVEFVQNNEEQCYDAWLTKPNYGIKEYIFGEPFYQSDDTHRLAKKKFMKMVLEFPWLEDQMQEFGRFDDK